MMRVIRGKYPFGLLAFSVCPLFGGLFICLADDWVVSLGYHG
jgi:hypothetical protein